MAKSKNKIVGFVDTSKDKDIVVGREMGEQDYANSQAAIDKEEWRKKEAKLAEQKQLDEKSQKEKQDILDWGNEKESLESQIAQYESKKDWSEEDKQEVNRLKKRHIELLNNAPWHFDQRYKRYKEQELKKKLEAPKEKIKELPKLNAPLGMEDSEDEGDVEIASNSLDEMSPQNYEYLMRKKLGYV